MWRFMTLCFSTFGPWILQALNLFADDFHVCDVFDSATEFDTCLHKLGHLLDLVEEAGLTINLEKTQMILATKGSKQTQLINVHTERTSKGWFILIPRRNGAPSRTRLVKQAVYLGAVINFTDHKDATVRSRLKCGHTAFNRLRKWLCGSRCLANAQKYQLWQACVLSILMYALPDIGITPKGCHQLLSTITCMLRKIYRDHPYHTGRTHQAFFSYHGLPTAVTLVRLRLEAHLQRLRTRLDWVSSDDIVHHRPLLNEWNQEHSQMTRTVDAELIQCPECQASFKSRTLLALHRMQDHRVLLQRPIVFDHARDARKGLPTCSHCLRDFQDWTHLRLRITSRGCLLFDATKEINDDIVRAQLQLRIHLMSESWDDIPQEQGLRAFLSTRCILCQRFVPRTQELTSHLRHSHSHLADRAVQAGRDYMSTRQHDPSSLCQRPHRRQGHLCPAAVNIQCFALHRAGRPVGVPSTSKAAILESQCHLCEFCCLDEQHLNCHLRHQHGLQSVALPPAPRDHSDHPAILEALNSGTIMDHLQACDLKMRLSLQCQLCPFTTTRLAGLFKHLQCAHGHLWLLSAEMCAMFQHFWQGMCVCNPAPAARKGHICVE